MRPGHLYGGESALGYLVWRDETLDVDGVNGVYLSTGEAALTLFGQSELVIFEGVELDVLFEVVGDGGAGVGWWRSL